MVTDDSSQRGGHDDEILLGVSAMQIYRKLGIDIDIGKRGSSLLSYTVGSASGQVIGKLQWEKFCDAMSLPLPVCINRSELLAVLTTAISRTGHFGTQEATIQRLEQEGDNVKVHTNEMGSFDMEAVLGCDGAHSKVRMAWEDHSFGQLSELSGNMRWQLSMPRPISCDPSSYTELWGAGKRLCVYPTSHLRMAVLGTTVNDQRLQDAEGVSAMRMREEFAPSFSGLGTHGLFNDLRNTSEGVSVVGERRFKSKHLLHPSLNAVVLGDAAMSASLHPLLGCSLSVEDGATLGHLLANHYNNNTMESSGNVRQVLEKWQSSRKPRHDFIYKECSRRDASAMTASRLQLQLRGLMMKWWSSTPRALMNQAKTFTNKSNELTTQFCQ